MTDLDPRVVQAISDEPLHWKHALVCIARLAADCERERCANAPDVVLNDDAFIAATAIASDAFGRRWADAEQVAKEVLRIRDCVGGRLRIAAAAIRGAKP